MPGVNKKKIRKVTNSKMEFKLFRTKSYGIPAAKWDGEFNDRIVPMEKSPKCKNCGKGYKVHAKVLNMLDGPYKICPGDWILVDMVGLLHGMKEEQFLNDYEVLGE